MTDRYSSPWRKALSSNSTATGNLTTKTPSTSEPSGSGIWDLFDKDLLLDVKPTWVAEKILLLPFGSDAANEDYHMQLWGWDKVLDEDVWIPLLLAHLVVTQGNVAATPLGTSNFLADTITASYGESSGDLESMLQITSPAADLPAHAIVHTRHCRYLEFDFDVNAGGTASASANCLWRPL